MGLGLFLGLCWGVGWVVLAALGAFADTAGEYRDMWLQVPVGAVLAIVFTLLGQVSLFFPRLVVGCTILIAPSTFVAGVMYVAAGHPKFAVPLFAMAVVMAGAFVLARRTISRLVLGRESRVSSG